MNQPTTDQMMAELTITFPALWKRRLNEFSTDLKDFEGVWTGQDSKHVMPDGDPIFNDLADCEESSNGTVHTGFEAWLKARGWSCERYDETTYFLTPDDPLPEVAP